MTDQEFFDAVIEALYSDTCAPECTSIAQSFLAYDITRAFYHSKADIARNLNGVAKGWGLNCDGLNRTISKQW